MSCGPSSQEKMIAGEQQHIGETLQANANSRFAQQSQILDNLNRSYAPIVAAGPNQQGFSPQLLSTLRSQAINNAGAAARNAQMSAGGILAGRGGGGDSGLVSGIDRQIRAGIASGQAMGLSNNLQDINLANYRQGNENYNRAMGGYQSLAGATDATNFANLATSGTNTAFGSADRVSQENNAKTAAIAGGIASLAKGALSFGMGGLGNLGGAGTGTSFGENVGNFFSGGFKSLAGG